MYYNYSKQAALSCRYSAGTPQVLRRYSAGTPQVLRRYSAGTPQVLRRYSGRVRLILGIVSFYYANNSAQAATSLVAVFVTLRLTTNCNHYII